MNLRLLPALAATGGLVLTGCSLTESSDSTGSQQISVTSSDDACTVEPATAAAGKVSFEIRNTGSQVTEFYLYRENGTSIVGEIENIGPGLSRDLIVTLGGGSYVTACKPGMTGDGIRGDFTVTGPTDVPTPEGGAAQTAIDRYSSYVHEQAEQLEKATEEFLAAYTAGRDERARSLYATARQPWERIEPVAESFGDLDPKMDLREADLTPGEQWTGWHAIEKDLWRPASTVPLGTGERQALAEDLIANTKELETRTGEVTLTLAQIGNGAKELLDEIATGKVTGEEEAFSHTDLYDIEANIDGAHEAFESLEPLLAGEHDDLIATIDSAFDAVRAELEKYRSGDGFVSYDTVGTAQRKRLSDVVNALGEPISQVTGAVVS